MNSETIPAESLLASRMHVMTLSVIGQLNATANWHRMMSEWIYGSLPATPWGVLKPGSRNAERLAERLGGMSQRWRGRMISWSWARPERGGSLPSASRERTHRVSILTQPAAGTMLMITRHGREETIGRLKVACARALSLINQMTMVSADRAVTDPARSRAGRRQRVGWPSSESTRSGEIPLVPGGAFSSKASSAEANGASRPALARTAARSALSSATSA